MIKSEKRTGKMFILTKLDERYEAMHRDAFVMPRYTARKREQKGEEEADFPAADSSVQQPRKHENGGMLC